MAINITAQSPALLPSDSPVLAGVMARYSRQNYKACVVFRYLVVRL